MRKLIMFTMVTILSTVTGPAFAQFGGVVFDPKNYKQNLVTAIRNVQQVNNQLQQIDNEIRILANQAEDLTSLPFSAAGVIDAKLQQIEALIDSANSIALSVTEMDAAYRVYFPDDYDALSNSETIEAARAQWALTRSAYYDALIVQAEVTDLVAADRTTLDQLVTESQASVGNLQAAQAGNQLAALQTKQMMQNQLLLASQYRADALERAQVTEVREQANARFSNFVGSGKGYTR